MATKESPTAGIITTNPFQVLLSPKILRPRQVAGGVRVPQVRSRANAPTRPKFPGPLEAQALIAYGMGYAAGRYYLVNHTDLSPASISPMTLFRQKDPQYSCGYNDERAPHHL